MSLSLKVAEPIDYDQLFAVITQTGFAPDPKTQGELKVLIAKSQTLDKILELWDKHWDKIAPLARTAEEAGDFMLLLERALLEAIKVQGLQHSLNQTRQALDQARSAQTFEDEPIIVLKGDNSAAPVAAAFYSFLLTLRKDFRADTIASIAKDMEEYYQQQTQKGTTHAVA